MGEFIIEMEGEYFQGKVFEFESIKYPCTTSVKGYAKRYNRKSNAERAKRMLKRKFSIEATVVEV